MHSPHFILKTILIAITATLVLLLAASPGLNAHDDGMPGQGRVPPHARDNMRAFASEHHHNEHLPAMSITTCSGGTAGPYPCSNVDLMAFLPLDQIGGGSGNDIWGWTDPLDGTEYAIMGLTNGTAFVDISDPVNPVYLGHLPRSPGVSASSWRDIKVFSNHALIGTEALGGGMQIMDLTQLRGIVSPPVTLVELPNSPYTGFSTSHNIVINEDSGFAYAVGTNTGSCNRGLTFVDIVDPANPQDAGCFSSDGYTHDAQCVNYAGPDADHAGKEICFAYNEDTLTIVDVSDKAAPVQISRTPYAPRGYSHQGWLTEDHAYVLLDDELDERNVPEVTNTRTLIWDVRDLDNPQYFDDYIGPSISIDHNQYTVGNHSFQANYRSGLRILDISDIANGNLVEVAYFDIYPADDNPNFNGAWSVYPFFASGNVVVSGIEQGLYILRPNLGAPNDPPAVSIIEPADGGPPLAGTVPVHINASDTEDAVGSLTVEWNVNGGAWQAALWDGAEYSANWDTTSVLDGSHVVNARAIDSGLSEGSDSSNVTVSNGASEFTVDAVNVSIEVGKGNRNTGMAVITVTDEAGAPLASVTIDGSFSGNWGGLRNGITDGGGQVSLNTPRVKNLNFVAFCVDNATKPGWDWNSGGSTICGDSDGGGAFGSMAGNVSNQAGDGITNASVSTDTGQSTNTDSWGDYGLAGVPVGSRTVSVTASGYQSQNKPANVTEGNTTIVDFTLTETPTGGSGSIKGAAKSGAGGKLSGVSVQVLGGSSSLTNKGGKYNIQNVPEGLQTVTASMAGFLSQQKDASVVAGGTVTVNFTLTPE